VKIPNVNIIVQVTPLSIPFRFSGYEFAVVNGTIVKNMTTFLTLYRREFI